MPFVTAAPEVVVRKFSSTRYRWFDDAALARIPRAYKVAAPCIPSTPWIECSVVSSCLVLRTADWFEMWPAPAVTLPPLLTTLNVFINVNIALY